MVSNGFGKTENLKVESLTSLNGVLFAKTYNESADLEIWRSTDGLTWEQIGLNATNNQSILWNASAVFQERLFIGVNSWKTGGQIWRMVEPFSKTTLADGATDISLSPTLEWTAHEDATGYEYCYSSAPGPCTRWNAVGMDTSVTLTGLAPDYTYHWQVRAITPGGTVEANAGQWWSFTTTATSACTWPAYTQPGTSSFGDVQMGWATWNWIERMRNAGITQGCGNGNYCPTDAVSRQHMAIFLLRGKYCGNAYTPPSVNGVSGFLDVQPGWVTAPWIKQLAADGITQGCGNGNYCPSTPVSRQHMAIFLLRAKHGGTYSPPGLDGGGSGFADVDPTWATAPWIKQLAAEGVTQGCGNGNYCPLDPVSRQHMAIFLVRAFGLP